MSTMEKMEKKSLKGIIRVNIHIEPLLSVKAQTQVLNWAAKHLPYCSVSLGLKEYHSCPVCCLYVCGHCTVARLMGLSGAVNHQLS